MSLLQLIKIHPKSFSFDCKPEKIRKYQKYLILIFLENEYSLQNGVKIIHYPL